MRRALISDIHGNLEALEAVLDDIKAQGIAESCEAHPGWRSRNTVVSNPNGVSSFGTRRNAFGVNGVYRI